MNLIMGDVEEIIMLVDAESMTNGQGVVNVCRLFQTTQELTCLILQVSQPLHSPVHWNVFPAVFIPHCLHPCALCASSMPWIPKTKRIINRTYGVSFS